MSADTIDTATRLRRILGVQRDEPAIQMEQLAQLRGFPSAEAARHFLRRHRDYIYFIKRGRRVLVTLADFDRGCAQMEDDRRKRA